MAHSCKAGSSGALACQQDATRKTPRQISFDPQVGWRKCHHFVLDKAGRVR